MELAIVNGKELLMYIGNCNEYSTAYIHCNMLL